MHDTFQDFFEIFYLTAIYVNLLQMKLVFQSK